MNNIFFLWKQLDLAKRIALLSLMLLASVSLFTIVFHFISSPYRVLFTGSQLDKTDESDIRASLDELQVPYYYQADGSLWIAKESDKKVRQQLALKGLPKENSKGFELYDDSTWLKGERELQILEIRALKGELERDLTAFNKVQGANIILDMPIAKPFGGKTAETKASVILKLAPGNTLSKQEVHAIASHMAAAIEGLTPEGVAVSDTTGRIYQAFPPDQASLKKEQIQRYAEDNLQRSIHSLLDTILGSESYQAEVAIVMKDLEGEEPKLAGFSVSVQLPPSLPTADRTSPGSLTPKEIEGRLNTLLQGMGVPFYVAVSLAQPMLATALEEPESESRASWGARWPEILFSLMLLVIVGGAGFLLTRKGKKAEPPLPVKTIEELIETLDHKMNQEPERVILAVKKWLKEGR